MSGFILCYHTGHLGNHWQCETGYKSTYRMNQRIKEIIKDRDQNLIVVLPKMSVVKEKLDKYNNFTDCKDIDFHDRSWG